MPHVSPGVPPPPEYLSLSAFYPILLCKSDVHPWENILLFSWVTILCPPVHRDTRSPYAIVPACVIFLAFIPLGLERSPQSVTLNEQVTECP